MSSTSLPTNEPTVRYATESDVPLILSLIQELAAYEHETSSVRATHASLLSTLSFPSSPASSRPGYARTLLIYPPEAPGQPEECAGFALFFYTYSTWRARPGIYLEDLFVRPAYRGRGYGKRLLGELARLVREVDGGRLEWACLKWNEKSLGFYEALGAKRMDGWVGLRVEDDEKAQGEGGEKGEKALEKLAGWGKGARWEEG